MSLLSLYPVRFSAQFEPTICREKIYEPVLNCTLTTSTAAPCPACSVDLAAARSGPRDLNRAIAREPGTPVIASAARLASLRAAGVQRLQGVEAPRRRAAEMRRLQAAQQAARARRLARRRREERAAWAAAPARPASWPSERPPCPAP